MKKLSDIAPIENSSVIISKKEEIKNYVELPLIKACEILWDKNIETYMSSANRQNVKYGCFLEIVYDTLSESNKEICKKKKWKIGKNRMGLNIVALELMTNGVDFDIEYIEHSFVEKVDMFKWQELKWGYQKIEDYYGHIKVLDLGAYTSLVNETIRIGRVDRGYWRDPKIPPFVDVKNKLVFASEEIYHKWKKKKFDILGIFYQKKV